MGQDGSESLFPDMSFPDVGVAVAMGTHRKLRVVGMDQPQPPREPEPPDLVEAGPDAIGYVERIPAREEMTGIRAQGELTVLAGYTEVDSAESAMVANESPATSSALARSVEPPADPAWTTTPKAPIASARATVARARSTDRRRKSMFGEATLTM